MTDLLSLDKSKTNAVGADEIPPWFSRLAGAHLAVPLAYLYSLSVAHSVVPEQWKCAIITPIPNLPITAQS